MAKNIFALLVGINEYDGGVRNLAGCVRDVERLHHFLGETFDSAYKPKILLDAEATRENIIDAFLSHLCRAGSDDAVLFHYSGHGAQSPSAVQFKAFFPEDMDEGLVCHNSRLPGHFDLADKELAVLIAEVARKDPHIAVIMDACHSGSGTRDVDDLEGLVPRYIPGTGKARPLDSYLNNLDNELGMFYQKLFNKDKSSFYVPASRHILLAACQPTQKAQEDPWEHYGVFSNSLINLLEECKGNISYADLFMRSRAEVRRFAKNQDPQFETFHGFNAYSGFIGRNVSSSHTRYYDVSFESGKWKVNAGAIQGLPSDPDKPVRLALFETTTQERSLGDASTTAIGPQSSELALPDPLANDRNKRYKARITSLPASPFLLHLEGAQEGQKVLTELKDPQTDIHYAKLINVVFSELPGNAKYSVNCREGRYELRQRETDHLIFYTKDYSKKSAQAVLDILQHIMRWEHLLGLENHYSLMDRSKVDFRFVPLIDAEERIFPHSAGEDVTLDFKGEEISGTFQVRNRTDQPLDYLLLYFSHKFGIFNLAKGKLPKTDDAGSFTTIWGEKPDETQFITNDEAKEEINLVRLFISTETVDDFLLTQTELDVHEDMGGNRGMGGGKPAKKFHENEWFLKTFRIRLVRQLNEQLGKENATVAGGKITIKKHPSLSGHLNLGRAANPTRSITDGPVVTDYLETHGLRIIDFAEGGRGDSENTLEFSDLPPNVNDLLKDTPLEIELDTKLMGLREEETVMPLVFDGEHWLIGGDVIRDSSDSAKIQISIDHVPDAEDNRRSLGKALKLYFFKAYLKMDDVNQLCWVDYRDDGSVLRHHDRGEIANRVAEGKNIILLIHGIIGDTQNIAEGLALAKDADGKRLSDYFDVTLTYDYENLNTPIEKTAELLKEDLRKIAGIQEDDDKHLTILAHSMGGLVSRHLVERLGGNKIVDHLVMCGTPNDGSPFGKVDLARRALSMLSVIALNVIPGMAAIGPIITGLLQRSKKLTPTLEQMNAQSEFLKTLNGSEDPGIRYTALGGDVDRYQSVSDKFFEKLLEKTGKSLFFDALYGRDPHDIAVSKNSILSIDTTRNPAPVKKGVDCHHMNYFAPGPGLEALGKVDW